MTITITSEQELKEVAAELLFVMAHLRHWQKEWNEHYGGSRLERRKEWEKRADALLERLAVDYNSAQQQSQVKVELKAKIERPKW